MLSSFVSRRIRAIGILRTFRGVEDEISGDFILVIPVITVRIANSVLSKCRVSHVVLTHQIVDYCRFLIRMLKLETALLT